MNNTQAPQMMLNISYNMNNSNNNSNITGTAPHKVRTANNSSEKKTPHSG